MPTNERSIPTEATIRHPNLCISLADTIPAKQKVCVASAPWNMYNSMSQVQENVRRKCFARMLIHKYTKCLKALRLSYEAQ